MRTNSGADAGPARPPRRRVLCALLALVLAALVLVSGCAATSAPARPRVETVRVAMLKGPTGVGMVHLMQAQQDGTAANDYSFSLSGAPDEVAAKVASGEVDIAAVPTNLAAVLYAKTSGAVQLLAVNTLGVLYLVENGSSVHGIADLKGRTIHASGQGSNPEYVLRFLLQKNGLDPDRDVHLVFKSQHDEVATLVAAGGAAVALLPEPFVTTVTVRRPSVRVALDLTDEWAKVVTDGSKPMTGAVIARRDFLDRNPLAVAAFLREYRTSIERARTDLGGTAALCQRFGIIPSAAVARLAIPRLNLAFLSGHEMEAGIRGYFEVLHAADPKSVGGALPDAGFYFRAP